MAKNEGTALEQLADRAISIAADLRRARTDLALAEITAADACIDGADIASAFRVVSDLRSRISILEHAKEALATRRITILNGLASVDANALRVEAAAVEREVEKIRKAAAKALGTLSELEGIAYTEAILYCEPGMQPPPRSAQLTARRVALQGKAREIGEREISRASSVDLEDATTADDIVRAVLLHRSLCPPAEAVMDWLAQCVSVAEGRGFKIAGHPWQVRIAWESSQITDQSWILVRALAPVVRHRHEIDDLNSEIRDFEAVTFRPRVPGAKEKP